MTNSKQILIQLSQIFDNNILSRSVISMLFNEPVGNACFILDFDSISFLSRSAAQQLELEKKKLQELNSTVSIINANENVLKMLSLAEDKSLIIIEQTITHKTFSSIQEQQEFMMSF